MARFIRTLGLSALAALVSWSFVSADSDFEFGPRDRAQQLGKRWFTGGGYSAMIGGSLDLYPGWVDCEYELERAFSDKDALAFRAGFGLYSSSSYNIATAGYHAGFFEFNIGASTRWFPFDHPVGLAGGPFRGMWFGGRLDFDFVAWNVTYNDPLCGTYGYSCQSYSASGLAVIPIPQFEVGWKFVFANGEWVVAPAARVGFGLALGASHVGVSANSVDVYSFGGFTSGLGVTLAHTLGRTR